MPSTTALNSPAPAPATNQMGKAPALNPPKTTPTSSAPVAGKVVTHWSQTAITLGGVVGTIIAISALVLKQYALAFTGGLLSLTSMVAVHFLRVFMTSKDIQSDTAQLAAKVQALSTTTAALQKDNQTLTVLKDSLAQQVSKAQALTSATASDLKEKTAGLQIATQKLQVVGEQLAKLQTVCQDMQASAKPLQSSVDQFKLENAALTSSNTQLNARVAEIESLNAQLKKEAEELKIHNLEFDKQNKDLLKSIELLKSISAASSRKLPEDGGSHVHAGEAALEKDIEVSKKTAEEAAREAERTKKSVEEVDEIAKTLAELNRVINPSRSKAKTGLEQKSITPSPA